MDTQFQELRVALSDYLYERRQFGSRGVVESGKAEKLMSVFRTNLAVLANELTWDTPDSVYAKMLVSFGIDGMMDDIYKLIWEKYYLEGLSPREMAIIINFSERNLRRLIAKLPSLIAEQLYQKHFELTNGGHVEPSTASQLKAKRLMDSFGLTSRQAEILMLLCEGGVYLGQKGMCLRLRLSESGFKKHIRSIIRKMHVTNRRDAITKAQAILGESEPE